MEEIIIEIKVMPERKEYYGSFNDLDIDLESFFYEHILGVDKNET